MSYQDDFSELEKRLRQSKPQVEPLPPALKRQMRQELMEQITVNENRFSFRKLGMALGGLILLIGIPVFFWLSQMSIGTGEVPGAAPDTSPIETTRPSPTRAVVVEGDPVLVPQVEMPEDRAWVISADIPQGQTVSRYRTINVTIGYELVNLPEAELVLKLVEGPRGVLTAKTLVSGAEGTAVIPLSLAELEEISGTSVDLELQIIVQEPEQLGGKLPYVDFVEGWTVDLTAAPLSATAEIIHISKPSIVETDGVVNESIFSVELTTAYSLIGYDNAVLVIGYEAIDSNGTTAGYEVNAISQGSGEVPVTIHMSREFFNARGETIETVNFFARINGYDTLAEEWVNLYPGNVTLEAGEANLPYPYLVDTLFVQSASWMEDEAGQMVLNVTVGYNLVSQASSELLINLTGDGGVLLASETAVIEQGSGSLTVPIAFNPSDIGDNSKIWISAELMTDAGLVEGRQLFWIPADLLNRVGDSAGNGSGDKIWVIATDVVTSTTENGVRVNVTFVVGYDLSSEYSGGHIAFSTQYSSPTNNGGGGGGGGGGSQSQLTPGIGTTQYEFGFETTSWAEAQAWLDGMSIYLKLFGITAEGDEFLIGEFSQIGVE